MSLPQTVHASAVAIGTHGILIRGTSGSGKSSLVLSLIDRDPATTRLVADDRVQLMVAGGRLIAMAPAALAGKLEVRGQGIVDIAHVPQSAITLVVDLRPLDQCPRMPEPAEMEADVIGVVLPRLMLPIGVSDASARVRFALGRLAPAPRPETAMALR
jgi:serine kinase of HPr protein (carbohydrate metabolism regulator)